VSRKIGLMGCGAIAQGRHIPAIFDTEGLELHAVFEPHEGRRARARDDLGIPHVFAEPAPFFESGVEAVSIVSPAPFHRDNVLGAARHGLPVLCEKPLAVSPAEATEMVAAMRAADAPLFTAFCYRFSPVALRIRELVRERAIGDVRALRLVYIWGALGKYETGPAGDRVLRPMRDGRMREGGPLVDCGTHQIDLARFWLGSEVTRFTGHGAWVDDYVAPDHVWVHMEHTGGAHTTVEVSYSYHHTSKRMRSEFVYELIGTDGVIRYDRNRRSFKMENGEGSHDLPFSREKNFPGMYAELLRFLETGHSSLLASAGDGLRATEIALGATAQAIQRRGGVVSRPGP
jgi:predicted dehydrogenase